MEAELDREAQEPVTPELAAPELAALAAELATELAQVLAARESAAPTSWSTAVVMSAGKLGTYAAIARRSWTAAQGLDTQSSLFAPPCAVEHSVVIL